MEKAKSVMADLREQSYLRAEEWEDVSRLKKSFYSIKAPGEYTDQPPYRDYPVVVAPDGMTAQIVGWWMDEADVETEQLDGTAWVLYVEH